MTTEAVDAEYLLYLSLWLIVPLSLFWLHSSRNRAAGIFVYSYFLGIFMAHWLGALVHASPWSQFPSSGDTISGFRLSTYGILALATGVLLVPSTAFGRQGAPSLTSQVKRLVPDRFAYQLVAIGLVANVLSFTFVAALPSAGAVLSAARQCLMLGMSIMCWNAWQRNDTRTFYSWLGLAFLLPVFTVVKMGFIGFGIVMLGSILLFIAMFYRPRWLVLLGLIGGIYGGMCVWVAYANNRSELRAQVWGGEGAEASFGVVQKMYNNLALFDFSDQNQLRLIDIRLNQNWLVGKALVTTPHFVPYEDGKTIWEALFAIVPRVIWPDKPEVGGSGNFVSDHTLIPFAVGTSVGMGQVFEFYINFGISGVLFGFFILGIFLRYFDIRFTQALQRGDPGDMVFFYLVGTAALQPGGSLSEIAAAVASAVVFGYLMIRYFGIGDRSGSRVLETVSTGSGNRY